MAYGANRTLYAGIDYDPDAQKFLVAHTDSTSSPYKGRYSVFTVSGQTPTMLTTDTQFDDGYASHINVVRNTTSKELQLFIMTHLNSQEEVWSHSDMLLLIRTSHQLTLYC